MHAKRPGGYGKKSGGVNQPPIAMEHLEGYKDSGKKQNRSTPVNADAPYPGNVVAMISKPVVGKGKK